MVRSEIVRQGQLHLEVVQVLSGSHLAHQLGLDDLALVEEQLGLILQILKGLLYLVEVELIGFGGVSVGLYCLALRLSLLLELIRKHPGLLLKHFKVDLLREGLNDIIRHLYP